MVAPVQEEPGSRQRARDEGDWQRASHPGVQRPPYQRAHAARPPPARRPHDASAPDWMQLWIVGRPGGRHTVVAALPQETTESISHLIERSAYRLRVVMEDL